MRAIGRDDGRGAEHDRQAAGRPRQGVHRVPWTARSATWTSSGSSATRSGPSATPRPKNVPDEHSGHASVTATCGPGRRSTPTPSWSRPGSSGSAPRRTATRSCATFARGCYPAQRIQLTTDGFGSYPPVVDALWRGHIDYAQIIKEYARPSPEDQRRYSPATCKVTDIKVLNGEPDAAHISHQLRRAAEPHHADGDAPLHPAHQRVLQEDREPHARSAASTSCTTTSDGRTPH